MRRLWLVLSVLSLALPGLCASAQGEGEDRTSSSTAAFSVEPSTVAVIPSTATQTQPPAQSQPSFRGDFSPPGGPQSPSNPTNPGNPGPAGGNMPREER
jgi:hypothetical protein